MVWQVVSCNKIVLYVVLLSIRPPNCPTDSCPGGVIVPLSQVRTLRFSGVSHYSNPGLDSEPSLLSVHWSTLQGFYLAFGGTFDLIDFGSYFIFHIHCTTIREVLENVWGWFRSTYFIETWKCLRKKMFLSSPGFLMFSFHILIPMATNYTYYTLYFKWCELFWSFSFDALSDKKILIFSEYIFRPALKLRRKKEKKKVHRLQNHDPKGFKTPGCVDKKTEAWVEGVQGYPTHGKQN